MATGTTSAATAAMAAAPASAGDLHAAADVFLVEQIERGEVHVRHFLFAEDEAMVGQTIVGLLDIGGGYFFF